MGNTRVQQQRLEAMDRILDLCHSVQNNKYEITIAKEIDSIKFLRSRVVAKWPLSWTLKPNICIGVYASRNLADWLPRLAHFIMFLDSVLKENGLDVDKLLDELSTYRVR